MKRSTTLEVSILRTRVALKNWIIKQIALTPAESDEEQDAATWFHDLPLADRSRMFLDLACLSLARVDLKPIASGPLGILLNRYPNLFPVSSSVPTRSETSDYSWSEKWNSHGRKLEAVTSSTD